MIKKIDVLDIIAECKAIRVDEYLKFYFSEFAQMNCNEVKYIKILDTPFYVSIIKDTSERILEHSKGKLMEKGWRICIFYFVNRNVLKKYFGINSNFPELNFYKGIIEYTGRYKTDYKGNNPDNIRLFDNQVYHIQDSVLTYFIENHSSWFVRSYVYINMIICDENQKITNRDYKIHYWNTNYKFRKSSVSKNIFYNSKYSYFESDVKTELENIEASNKEIIDCVNAYNGSLDFKINTQENFNEIKNDIDNGIPYIVVQGSARTGKTIIALRLLGTYQESKLLIMNYYFYQALKDGFGILNVNFPDDRIYHHSLNQNKRLKGGWIHDVKSKKIIPSLSFLIVDEAQRLSYIPSKPLNGLSSLDEINSIINCSNHKHTIFLGDDFQRLNPKYDQGFERILKLLSDKDFREYSFREPIGVPPEILNNVKYLIDINNDYAPTNPNNFQFNVTKNINDFVSAFLNDKVKRKHYVYVGLIRANESPIIKIDEDNIIQPLPEILSDVNFNFLFDSEIASKYMLSTYEVISREIESVYLYLPNIINYYSEENELRFLNQDSIYFLRHLYVLMTRATLKLTIFCENTDLFNYFNEKINKIYGLKNYDNDLTENTEEDTMIINDDQNSNNNASFKYDVFIAYHGSSDPNGSYSSAKQLADEFKKNGFLVFLNNYCCLPDDHDVGFNETQYILQKAYLFILVFNDFVQRDSSGMIMRKYDDGTPNQLYRELRTFTDMVNMGDRTNIRNLRFLYTGKKMQKSEIYKFLNTFYREGTYGNSDCCFTKIEEVITWLKNRKI